MNCTKCGADLRGAKKAEPAAAAEPSRPSGPTPLVPAPSAGTPEAKTKHCPICGRPMGYYASMCDYCSRSEQEYAERDSQGEIYGDTIYHPETQKPVAAGVLILIAGILGIGQSFIMMGANFTFCCSGIFGLFGLIAVVGSFSAMNRTNMWFAVIAGIFGMLAVGFVIGAILALVAIVLVATSSNEFRE